MNTRLPKTVLPAHRFDPTVTSLDRHRLIAEAAFVFAERRDFAPGGSIDDWLAAERDLNAACGLIEPEPRWDVG